MSFLVQVRGTTPAALARRLRRIPQQIRQQAIQRPTTRLRREIPKEIDKDIRKTVAISQANIRQLGVLTSFVRNIPNGKKIRTIIRSRMIPLEMLRARYFPGREAGAGSAYGRGTSYTLYKGERQTARNVFQRPSTANPGTRRGGRLRGLADDAYITRRGEDVDRFPIRRWRGLNIASFYRNDRGRRQLPALRGTLAGLARQIMVEQMARILGRPANLGRR